MRRDSQRTIICEKKILWNQVNIIVVPWNIKYWKKTIGKTQLSRFYCNQQVSCSKCRFLDNLVRKFWVILKKVSIKIFELCVHLYKTKEFGYTTGSTAQDLIKAKFQFNSENNRVILHSETYHPRWSVLQK